MQRLSVLLLAALFVMIPSRSAQSQSMQTTTSPEVLADGRIVFRLIAPGAAHVLLALEGSETPVPVFMPMDLLAEEIVAVAWSKA